MAITSPFPDVEIPDLPVYDFLFRDLPGSALTSTAVLDSVSGRATSYGELLDQVDRVAGALAARGIGPGDVVALHSPNSPAFVALFHGILRAGATVTTVNSLYTGDEIGRQLADSRARLAITVGVLRENMAAGAAAAGVGTVMVVDGAEGHESLADWLGEARTAPVVSIDPATHLAVLPYSSGTTGLAKGVMLTHRNLVANVAQTIGIITLGPDDRVAAVLPFFHIYGMTVLLNLSLFARAQLVTFPRFDLAQFLGAIAEHRCTYLFIAPPIALALARHPLVAEHDLGSVHTILSGAAPLDGALADAVAERLSCRVVQGYGMTEMSPVSHAVPADRTDIPRGSVGLVIPNMVCRLVDPTDGHDIPVPDEGMSEPGELWCQGPNVMTGYLGDDDATAQTLDADGFLHTGDIATVDASGAFYVVDRLKELIKYHGYQVPPAELEALLLTHPDVQDAAVIGVPDDDGQEVPKAFVVRASQDLTAETLMAWVAERVAAHKKIRRVEFIDAVPKSASGKILRKDLRTR
ncbi:AMP-binding protein [Cellulomonas sp. PhB150]|uniref:AMP-binding protein n=1 Tax=Cellulomonas sp. PhB150 TaxID=2485188 RepID=UPI000F46259F|nr:AMP-binding protein [Cellulomonas sp. PhB150]ROS27893.1 acyl-CoA synthetase (AMP-forming)/AMP-acid ligase II [Cellulomonas sp. PhB150]